MPLKVDPTLLSNESLELQAKLKSRIIGQDRALDRLVYSLQKYRCGLQDPHRPLATLLFMGPSGVGKSEVAHVLAEILFDHRNALTRIDASEFRFEHEVAKLIGAPPGYIGHKDSGARLTQARLDRWQDKDKPKLNILLFDEIEKSHDSLHALLLGAFDYGRIVLGDGEEINLTKTIIICTSNLGSRDTEKLVNSSDIGFRTNSQREDVDQKIYEVAKKAAQRFFRPEWLNRIDRMIVFRSLSQAHLSKILNLELNKVQNRIIDSPVRFVFRTSAAAKAFLLKEGTSETYGARELKRAVEKYIAEPLSSLVGSEQIDAKDTLFVDIENGILTFNKVSDPLLPVQVSKQIAM